MADDIYAKVGAAIRSKRDELGMTQASLADRTGLGRTSITNIEKGGQSILLHQLVDVARALRADPRDFLANLERDDAVEATPSGKMAELLSRTRYPGAGTTAMTPRRARYSKIERVVGGLLASAPPVAPVPVERMVRDRGIALRKGNLGDVSGLLLRNSDTTTIGVNSSQSSVRQRFTIAHEFGHFLLHEGIVEHVDHDYRINYRSEVSSRATDVEEIEANFFAASLLMPRSMLDERNAVAALDDDNMVKALAREFDVSQHAISLRLANIYREFAPY